jgi:hypothetical protein
MAYGIANTISAHGDGVDVGVGGMLSGIADIMMPDFRE